MSELSCPELVHRIHGTFRIGEIIPGVRHHFAEGQRRYVESLSAYARQFLGRVDKPDIDFIEGLSPAVSIDQKSTSRNPVPQSVL